MIISLNYKDLIYNYKTIDTFKRVQVHNCQILTMSIDSFDKTIFNFNTY
jgi:hypothetical protein